MRPAPLAVPPLAVLLLAGAVVAVTAVAGPLAALAALGVLGGVAALVLKPHWSVYAVVVTAFTATPAVLPNQVAVGGFELEAFEPFLVVALGWALLRRRRGVRDGRPRAAPWAIVPLVVLVVGWSVVGLIAGHPIAKVILDTRHLAELVAAMVVAAAADEHVRRRAVQLLVPVLWISAAVTVLASVAGLPIAGNVEQATLYLAAASSDATRIRTDATDLALVVLCVVVAGWLCRRLTARPLLVLGPPAFLIVFLAFSRYTVPALGVAVLFGLLGTRRFAAAARTLRVGGTAVLLAALLTVAAPLTAGLPGSAYLDTQISGFTERVVAGLSSQVLAADGSVQFRAQEDALALPQIVAQPVAGYGFGYAYKAPQPPAGSFYSDYAPYYLHDYYLWLLLKTGLIGTLLFAAGAVLPVALALRGRSDRAVLLGAAAAALLVASVAAPMPNTVGSSVLLGALLGALVAQARDRASAPACTATTVASAATIATAAPVAPAA